MSSKPRDIAITASLAIVLGLLPWLLEKQGVGMPTWLITFGGVLAILGACYGLFFPISRVLGKVLGTWGATTISTSHGASLALMFVLAAALTSFWIKTYDYRKWQSDANETIARKSFFNETVVLDGKTFEHCKFTNVRFMYHGRANTTMVDSQFSGTIYLQTDNAAAKGFAILLGYLSKLPSVNTVVIGDVNPSGKVHVMEVLHPADDPPKP